MASDGCLGKPEYDSCPVFEARLECSGWTRVEPALEIFALLLKPRDDGRVGIECQKLVEDGNPLVQFLGRHRHRLGGIIILVAKIEVNPPDLPDAARLSRVFRDSVADMSLNSTQRIGDGRPSRRRDVAFSSLKDEGFSGPGLAPSRVGERLVCEVGPGQA